VPDAVIDLGYRCLEYLGAQPWSLRLLSYNYNAFADNSILYAVLWKILKVLFYYKIVFNLVFWKYSYYSILFGIFKNTFSKYFAHDCPYVEQYVKNGIVNSLLNIVHTSTNG